ncbi:MAG: hypothetical protein ABJ275_11595 [Maricaulaceae bacterium]
MTRLTRLLIGASMVAIAPLSFAQDKDKDQDSETTVELREEIRCFPAKGIRDFMGRFDSLEASQRDTIDVFFEPKFVIRDEGTYPDRYYLKQDGAEIDLPINEEGEVPDFVETVKNSAETSEICLQDKARAGTPVDQAGVSFSFPTSIRHIKADGTYDLATLKDGLKDGKSFYKKMVGGAMALLVPKMTHIVVSYDDETTAPQILAFKDDVALEGLESEFFDGAHVVRFKDLKKMGATHLKITGGDHSVAPAPSIKTMKKFGIGG